MTLGSSLDEDGLVIGKSDAIYTYTGRLIRPLDPDPDDICIEDIAHALANQCRFTGHAKRFLSVAEHSMLCAHVVAPEHKLETLLHDASEAYLADIARPVKKAPDFAMYLEFERKLETAIQIKFGLPVGPMPGYVKVADERILGIEIHTNCHEDFARAYGVIEPWGATVEPFFLTPSVAEEWFLAEFDLYWATRPIRKTLRGES